MFKKKPSIKTLAPLRSSDRRKVIDQIVAEYGVEVPKKDEAEEHQHDQGSTPGAVGTLRNSLLPEGSLSAKFSTTIGQDLKTVTGTLYVGSHPHEEQRILWVKFEEKVFPTVYTLWRHPGLIPLIHTPDIVLRKMRGGADLMTPGLARGPPFPTKAIKDAVVAVASLEKPSVPVVVGVCEINISTLSQIQGTKGRAVKSMHWEGDELWSWSHTGKPGKFAPDHLVGWDEDDNIEGLERAAQRLNLGDPDSDRENGGVRLTLDPDQTEVEGDHELPVQSEGNITSANMSAEYKGMNTKEVDTCFRNAFLYAIHEQRNGHKDDRYHGLSFPISQSLFISNLVLPYLPLFTAEDADALQMKRTSWKNAKRFIKALNKEKLIKSKDRNGGETIIQDIDFNDPAITSFVPYKLPKREAPKGESNEINEDTNVASDNSIGQSLQKLTLLKSKDKLAPIFQSSSTSLKTLYLPTELRPLITAYLEAENLISTTNKRLVNLDPFLANAVFDTPSSLDREVLAKGSVPRDALLDRIVQSCTIYTAILRNDETRADAKPKAGPAPSIKILLETRSGNKTVTKVSGVEAFYINPQLLADELQKTCASSTSVGQLVGSSPKHPVMEIMIQGPQKEIVVKALEKRGVHRLWVEVLDKTKAKKR